jgi:16S rRNA A1518/A1519 N6-dimethyltransferase RsmA/KsgA/DIM1 with predicted DNA glycosylase/AP lyase activity
MLLLQVPNLQLVHGDVMRLDLQALIAQMAAAAAAGQQDSSSSSQPSSSDPQQQQQQLQQAFQEALEQPAAAGGSSNSSSRSSSATAPARQRRRGVKVVANLPYNITKEFLQAMLPQGGVVSELSIMIQVRLIRVASATAAATARRCKHTEDQAQQQLWWWCDLGWGKAQASTCLLATHAALPNYVRCCKPQPAS